MALVRSFRDLIVYQKALHEAGRLHLIATGFPASERYALGDQLRRASRGVAAHVSEGWGNRRQRTSFFESICQAAAGASETRAWLDHAVICGYISKDEHADLDRAWDEIGGRLHALMKNWKFPDERVEAGA